jgi:predicted metallopeptidase
MKVFGWEIKRNGQPLPQEPARPQIKEAAGTQINKGNYKNFLVKAIGFIAGQGGARGDFSEPEYNLEEIKRAADGDSYIKMSLMKYSYLMYKAGYTLKGNNDKAIEYLKMRFRIMSFATGKPVDILLQEVSDDLIKYSNAFLIKSRVDKLMPGVQAKGVFADKPIGGYYRVDASSVKIQRDKNGLIKKYQQGSASGDTKDFNPTEVIHFYLDKDSNNAFGTPRIIAALEDVKLLRRIEGNVISLIYRFSIPIYQWMIGIPQQGFQATDQEIKDAQVEIENMPLDGVIVTNEKTQIKAIGAEGQALDASKYLLYFEKRVFSALGVSESQMGRGGAKQDSDSMEAQTHDTVKYIQRVMSIFVDNYIINELLLEGGFNPIMKEEDIINYEFNEISLDTKVKVENHEMLKFESNVTTFEEARQAMGYKTEADEARLYANMVQTPAAIEQIDAKTQGSLELAKLSAQTSAAANKGNGKTASAKPSGAVKSTARPTNQHGTTSAKIKSSMDDDISFEVSEALSIEEKASVKLKNHKNSFSSVYKKYENMRNDIAETNADIDILLPLTKDSIMSDLKTLIKMNSFNGTEKAVKEINRNSSTHNLIPNANIQLDRFIEEADKTLVDMFKDIKKRLGTNRDPETVTAVVNVFEYRIRFLLEFLLPKVYWYSYVKTGAALGIDKAYIDFDGSEDNKDHPSVINTKSFSIDNIPAYHSFCNCTVSFKEPKAGEK